MNPKIKKVIDEIDRTKAKILELQTLLPELERKRIDMENTEIIKLIRSADILPAEIPAFIESLKNPKTAESASALATASAHAPAPIPSEQHGHGGAGGFDVERNVGVGDNHHGSDHADDE